MLVNFEVDNWKSFKDTASFTMLAGKERQHRSRTFALKKYRTRILPLAALYGANASGKSNFFKALKFAQNFITKHRSKDSVIPVEPFLLKEKADQRPTRFLFEILIDQDIYRYSFSVTRREVCEETLSKILGSGEEILLYSRTKKEINLQHFTSAKDGKKQRLEYIFEGTQENQLFLYNSVSQNMNDFLPLYQWFEKKLLLIAPEALYSNFAAWDSSMFKNMSQYLETFDTGIKSLEKEEYLVNEDKLPPDILNALPSSLEEGSSPHFFIGNSRIFKRDGKLWGERLCSFHSSDKGEKVKFNIAMESDGTLRLLNVLPAFFMLGQDNSQLVVVIDELDRSMHSLLSQKLLSAYLECCSETSRSQLIFSTHDTFLMNQSYLRRDEMWIAERDENGTSSLFSISDYKDLRDDTDMRRNYLRGRFGGIPRIIADKAFCSSGMTE